MGTGSNHRLPPTLQTNQARWCVVSSRMDEGNKIAKGVSMKTIAGIIVGIMYGSLMTSAVWNTIMFSKPEPLIVGCVVTVITLGIICAAVIATD